MRLISYHRSYRTVSFQRLSQKAHIMTVKSCGILASFITILTLSGCGFLPAQPNDSSNIQQQSWQPAAQPHAPVQKSTLAGQQQPGSIINTEHSSSVTSRPVMRPKGLNLADYFAYDIKNPIERVKRTETAMIAMQSQLNYISSMLENLSASNAATTGYGTVNASQTPRALTPDAKPSISTATIHKPHHSAVNAPLKTVAKAPSGPLQISQLRVGEHSTKTRLVLDANGAAKYQYDLDNNENLLVIEFKDAAWKAAKSMKLAKSPLIASYNVYDIKDTSGARLVIQLKAPVKIISESTLAPASTTPYHRLVFDLSKI